MQDISPTPMADQIACVRRELALRKNVYPKWVKNGRMTQLTADKEINALQAVHDTLVAVKGMDGAAPSAPVGMAMPPAGHKIVPLEPTEKMLLAGCKAALDFGVLVDDRRFSCERAAWNAMLGAAP